MIYTSISLPEPMFNYLKELVSNGGYNSVSEVIREAIRLHQKVEIKLRVSV